MAERGPAIGVDGEGAVPFGVNEMRLDWRQWAVVVVLVVAFGIVVPRIWKRAERFDTGPDYRIPYALSGDYWLYQRRVERVPGRAIPVLGDSVVWGEYVRPDGTLSHFLSAAAGEPGRFVNCGLNGVFPLAMEGLAAHYGGALHSRKVIVQYNVLWMSSPKADLSAPEEETFNHTALVPQLFTRIPCYRADASTRLNTVVSRSIGLLGWTNHLDSVYFDHLSVPLWTLEEDSADPPRRPNAWRNPLAQIKMRVPGEPANDPQRGPTSPRHRPWNAHGGTTTHFDWVRPEESLQWRAFQRLLGLLRTRGDDVIVIIGPFNEWMVAEDQRPTYRRIRGDVDAWLSANRYPHILPETLPSSLYADASHPLTEGYHLLAARISRNPDFERWLRN